MWIFMNDSCLSIVRHTDKSDTLLVRARMAGDIEAVFPGAKVRVGEGNDYRYRADVPTQAVSQAIASRIDAIDYPNFKGSVRDTSRHNAYMRVWETMWRWGEHYASKQQ